MNTVLKLESDPKSMWQKIIAEHRSGSLFSHSVTFDSSVTPWIVAHQAPLSMGFPRQKYWCGLLLTSPGELPDPGIEPASLTSPALVGGFFTTEPPGKPRKP